MCVPATLLISSFADLPNGVRDALPGGVRELGDLGGYVTERGQVWADHALMITFILIVAWVARWLLHRMIDRVVNRAIDTVMPTSWGKLPVSRAATIGRSAEETDPPGSYPARRSRREQRARTMGSLLKSIITGLITAIAITAVLSEVGVNVAPIIASAGVVGVALGFGSQSLVKDFLSGIFMIFEDQYGVGDVVDLGEASGTVEAVSLRVTRLRDVNGTVWYVRNGEILRVGNQSQNWARTVLDIAVSYNCDLHKVQEILRDVAHDLWDDEDFRGVILEEPEVWGVEQMTPDALTVRVTLKTAPLQQWRVAREMRQRIKTRFEHEGIEMPRPQRVLWHQHADQTDQTDQTGASDHHDPTRGTTPSNGSNHDE